MEIPIELEFGIDTMENYNQSINELADNLQRKHPDHNKVVDKTDEIRSYYKYKLERMNAKHEYAKLNEYLYANAENGYDHTIPIELLKWYTTSKMYMHALKKEISGIFDDYIKTIQQQQIIICKTIKQKKRNHIKNQMKNTKETEIENQVLEKIKSMPEDILKHIADYAITMQVKIAIYKKTDSEIENLTKSTKIHLLHPFLKNIKARAAQITMAISRKPAKSNILKPEDYICLRHMNGTTKSQIASIIIQSLKCYNYLYSITEHYSNYRVISNAIEKELLYIYTTITYIARPELNRRRN
jgi:hypothetical protein